MGKKCKQTSLKSLEKKVFGEFCYRKFIYCSDAGLGSEELLDALNAINFVQIQEHGFIPSYKCESITDDLDACGFRTDYQFITKSKMKTIQKKITEGNKLLYTV
ncbi:MAG: hypothetical protein K2I03_03060, partial [Lachnospiraceae bacterium]|nr:hypothetical protein [Lachnospiraceae bacterium]